MCYYTLLMSNFVWLNWAHFREFVDFVSCAVFPGAQKHLIAAGLPPEVALPERRTVWRALWWLKWPVSWGVYLLILVWLTRSALDLVIWTGCACVFDGAGRRGISRSAYRVGDESVGCVGLEWSVCTSIASSADSKLYATYTCASSRVFWVW